MTFHQHLPAPFGRGIAGSPPVPTAYSCNMGNEGRGKLHPALHILGAVLLLPTTGLSAGVPESAGAREFRAMDPSAVHHVFSETEFLLHYDFLLPFTGTVQVEADLYLVSDRLAAPLAREIPAELDPPEPRSSGRARFTVTAPKVDKTSNLLLLPRVRHEEKSWISLPLVRIRVYPPDLLDPLREYATTYPLHLDIGSLRLQTWLTAENIPFEVVQKTDTGQFSPKGMILFETADPSDLSFPATPSREQVFILFAAEGTGMPRTIIQPKGAGTVMEVRLPVLENVADDPLAQKTFIEIIETAHNQLHKLEQQTSLP